MKIRGNFEKINPLYSLYVILGLLCVAVPFRMYQLLEMVESDTGFYKEVNWSVYAMYVIYALAFLVPYVLTNLAKNIPESRAVYRKNKVLAASSFVFGIGLVADAVITFSTVILTYQGFLTEEISLVPMLLEGVFGILSAVYIMIFGISYIDGRTTYSKYKFLALAPLVWSITRLIIRFVKKISYVNVSDLLLELFAIAFMMLFFMSFARISSGLSNSKAMRGLWASGFVAAFFCVVANLPRLIAVVTGNGSALPEEYPFSLCDLSFAFFAVAYIVNSLKVAENNDGLELLGETEEDMAPVMDEAISEE